MNYSSELRIEIQVLFDKFYGEIWTRFVLWNTDIEILTDISVELIETEDIWILKDKVQHKALHFFGKLETSSELAKQ